MGSLHVYGRRIAAYIRSEDREVKADTRMLVF